MALSCASDHCDPLCSSIGVLLFLLQAIFVHSLDFPSSSIYLIHFAFNLTFQAHPFSFQSPFFDALLVIQARRYHLAKRAECCSEPRESWNLLIYFVSSLFQFDCFHYLFNQCWNDSQHLKISTVLWLSDLYLHFVRFLILCSLVAFGCLTYLWNVILERYDCVLLFGKYCFFMFLRPG